MHRVGLAGLLHEVLRDASREALGVDHAALEFWAYAQDVVFGVDDGVVPHEVLPREPVEGDEGRLHLGGSRGVSAAQGGEKVLSGPGSS